MLDAWWVWLVVIVLIYVAQFAIVQPQRFGQPYRGPFRPWFHRLLLRLTGLRSQRTTGEADGDEG